MMPSAHGYVPFSFVLLQFLRSNGFDTILGEHFSDLNPEVRPEVYIPGFRMGVQP